MKIYLVYSGGARTRWDMLFKKGCCHLVSYFFLRDNIFGVMDRFKEQIKKLKDKK